MRRVVSVLAFAVGVAVVGCAQDKYNLNPVHKEAPFLPPDEKRYNEPETAPYRKPPAPLQEEKALLNRPMNGPNGLGGF